MLILGAMMATFLESFGVYAQLEVVVSQTPNLLYSTPTRLSVPTALFPRLRSSIRQFWTPRGQYKRRKLLDLVCRNPDNYIKAEAANSASVECSSIGSYLP